MQRFSPDNHMTGDADCSRHDVIIMGGGLAGLCLSIQLKNRLPDLDILVIERRTHPVPEATHKIGESCVEIAANYFDTVLGLKEHLVSRQLKKFGFRFFFSEGRADIDSVTEVGASRYLYTPSYQIDRGIFENFLGNTAIALGVRFVHGAMIRAFQLGADSDGDKLTDDNAICNDHEISYIYDGEKHTARGRWLIDATGRSGLIKHRLGLQQENGHNANAVWFRIGKRITIDEWSKDPQWQARCTPRARWLSTNHLVGNGYWAWLIPLSSGSHSVGIVADSRIHPSKTLDSFDKVVAWLDLHQPRLATELREKKDLLQDFAFLRRFSYGCKQVFSGKRWALTGEAGVFLDPFYSPGSDFIAISNTYIAELVVKDHQGESIQRLAPIYERFYLSFYESTLSLYKDQYPMFGNAVVFPIKILWDYTYYWGILCQIFFQRRLTDVEALSALGKELRLCTELNLQIQHFLRSWSEVSRENNPAVMCDQAKLGWFTELNRGLGDELDDDGFARRVREYTRCLQALALEIVDAAQAEHSELTADAIRRLVDIQVTAINDAATDVDFSNREAAGPLLEHGWLLTAH